jgi:hypothetical protein
MDGIKIAFIDCYNNLNRQKKGKERNKYLSNLISTKLYFIFVDYLYQFHLFYLFSVVDIDKKNNFLFSSELSRATLAKKHKLCTNCL